MPQFKKVICLLVEGFGLSANWQKNAIASAQAGSFLKLWQDYQHFILHPTVAPEQDQIIESAYSLIGMGRKVTSNKDFLDELLEKSNGFKSENLEIALSTCKKHNSCLHLIGNLSKAKSSKSHLLALINAAKKNSLVRIFVHLIIDDSFADQSDLMVTASEWDNALVGTGVAEIATIGQESIALKNPSKYFRCLVSGEGIKALSVTQALSRVSKQSPSKSEPIILAQGRGKIISDFDTIIFFNHAIGQFEPLILPFTSNVIQQGNPRFLNVSTLIDFPSLFASSLTPLFTRLKPQTLGQLLNKHHIPAQFICEKARSPIIRYYLGSNTETEKLLPTSENVSQEDVLAVLDSLVEVIEKDRRSLFTFVNISFLAQICGSGNFDNAVFAVRELDKFLLGLHKYALSENVLILFTSPYGLAEELTFSRSQNKPIISKNPLPFIFAGAGLEKNNNLDLISELLKVKKSDLSFVFQNILKLFNIKE